jgi:putative N6-adenine-specific DNA methylase
MELKMCVPTLFGLEGLAADELKRLNMKNVTAENGRVIFYGENVDLARANINIRTGERVLLMVGESEAMTFDALFEAVKAMPWEEYIPADGAFPVKGYSLNSQLHSVPDCQSIIKKAVVERLRQRYKTEWFPETGATYQIRFSIMKDVAGLFLDTSGAGLHKRGYRPAGNAAPIRETLAAAMVKLSRFRGREPFCDPFCGSGTIPIEAALAALNRAPGLGRKFAAQDWAWPGRDIWTSAAAEARDKEYKNNYDIQGGDIDPRSVEISRENAARAGVLEHITFETADAAAFRRDTPGGIIVTNPPYGERVMQKSEAEKIYREFGQALKTLSGWKYYILSSHTEFERFFGRRADKKRKLYNGMIKCDLFMYL